MLAVKSGTMLPAMNARKATLVIESFRSGASTVKVPIMIPIELGLAKPQTA